MKKLHINESNELDNRVIKEDAEIGEFVTWDELNDAQRQYVLDCIESPRNYEFDKLYFSLIDWFDEDIMDTYHYDVSELVSEYSSLEIDADKLYWQSNSHGPYPEWSLDKVFNHQYIEGDDYCVTINFYGSSTDVDVELTIEYKDADGDWMTEWGADIDDLSNPEYHIPQETIDSVQQIANDAQEFINKVWELIHDVCTAYPEIDWIEDTLDGNPYSFTFEVMSDTEVEYVR